jgi:hypothetical protein
MAINSQEEYQKVLDVSWYTGDKSVEELMYVPKPKLTVGAHR